MDLHQKFKQLKLPICYTLDEIDVFFKIKYAAIEIDKEKFRELTKDPYINFENIIRCYKIDNQVVLNNLYSDHEKNTHNEFVKLFKELPVSLNDDQKESVENQKIQTGNLLYIILESENGKHISSFTLQGKSEKLLNQLIIFQGIDPEDCVPGNYKYIKYLSVLLEEGYLS